MSVRRDVGGLDPLNIIELFELDTTVIGQPDILRWTQGPGDGFEVVWQGETYTAFPIACDGFAMATSGALPRPTLSASNIGGILGQYVRSIRDGLGAKVTRKRTLVKYLDAVNFPGGVNPSADPTAHFPDDVFYVARRVSEDAIAITFELAVAFDVQGVQLPRRQVIAGTCSWIYRGPECGYAGPPVQDINGNPTSDPAKDRCRKTLAACRARFPDPTPLPTSTFPASLLISG